MMTTATVVVALIEAHGPITVTDQQLRDANPYRLYQSYDPTNHTWTFTVDGPDSASRSEGSAG